MSKGGGVGERERERIFIWKMRTISSGCCQSLLI